MGCGDAPEGPKRKWHDTTLITQRRDSFLFDFFGYLDVTCVFIREEVYVMISLNPLTANLLECTHRVFLAQNNCMENEAII